MTFRSKRWATSIHFRTGSKPRWLHRTRWSVLYRWWGYGHASRRIHRSQNVCASARPNAVEIGPEATLRAFIQTFDNLDWERFRSFFADDATVFYPRGMARRAHGRAEIE